MTFAFITLLISSGGYIFYLLQKLEVQRKYIISLNSENSRLRKTSLLSKDFNSITIEFMKCPCSEGIVKYDAKLYFAPVSWSPYLSKLKKASKVLILEKARVEGRNWYYVEIYIPTRANGKKINSRGWILCENILTLEEPELITEGTYGMNNIVKY